MSHRKQNPYWSSTHRVPKEEDKTSRKKIAVVEIDITFYLINGYLTTEKPNRESWER